MEKITEMLVTKKARGFWILVVFLLLYAYTWKQRAYNCE